jgi:hypothetical protein
LDHALGNSFTYLSGTSLISFIAFAAAAASKGFTPFTICPPSLAAGATTSFIKCRRSLTAAARSSAEIATVAKPPIPSSTNATMNDFLITLSPPHRARRSGPLHHSDLL